MKPIVRYRPQVLLDLVEAADYIARDSPAAAERFLRAAEATFDLLAQSLMLATRSEFEHPELRDLRRWRVRGFRRYLIFYRPLPDGVEIVRVLHGARDIEMLFDDQTT